MAPPTGPRALGSSATRGRGNTRGGGIQKRGAAPRVRTDRDGDVSMDAPARGGNAPGAPGAPRGPSRGGRKPAAPSRSSQRTAQNLAAYTSKDFTVETGRGGRVSLNASKARYAHTAVLTVNGLDFTDPDPKKLQSLLSFLERKASKNQTKQITINKSVVDGNTLYIQVSKDDVPNFLHLDGFTYGPSSMKLSVAESEKPWPQKKAQLTESAARTKEQLKGVLFNRYNVDGRILDLSNLGQDPQLVSMGLFEKSSTPEKAFKALILISDQQFDTAKAKAEAIQGVTLASNGLGTIQPVFDLAETFPQLKMLDLSNNAIKSLKQLTRWRGRFRSLENLVMVGNPIETEEPNYKTELMQWFPHLQFLNGDHVRTAEEIAAREAATRPQPIPQAGPDFRDSDGVGETFLRTFIPLYDSDRSALLATFYDEESRFTLSVVNNKMPTDNPVPAWQPYLKFSRNQAKITVEAARTQRLFEGSATISDLWKQLPATRHPDLIDQSKYIIDCHTIPGIMDPTGQIPGGVGGLLITIHGQFQEADRENPAKTGMRSFSRTIVLGPGRPGRNPIRVISDMLSLRAFAPVPVFAAAVGIDVQERQKQMVLELTNRTRMTLEYSQMCLEGVAWDFDKALLAFEEKRAMLPPDAFITA
ncbi:TAP domain-containing protein [Coniochaeta sp. 2T2.1]|nr:TAP domain-containing protein [Coniochaeta sp. 2T2.1]